MKLLHYRLQYYFAIINIIWPASLLVRCIIEGSDFFYDICFAAMVINAYYLMFKPSRQELREAKEKLQHNEH